MAMPGRKYSAGSGYRYGFNTQERSTEINENSYTAEFWEYDSRIGRRWNLDPKPNVSISLYAVFENNPLWFNDKRGDTPTVGNQPSPVQVGTSTYYLDRFNDYLKRRTQLKYNSKTRTTVLVNLPPSYYLNYGNKYMNRFKNVTKKTLSPQGQKWLDKTLVNLQEAIENKLTKTKEGVTIENDDKKFTDFAFETHVAAYEKAGVLSLPIMDKVKIGLTPDAQDLFSDRGIKQASQIALDQAAYYITHPVFAHKQAAEIVTNLKEITTLVHNYYIANKPFFDEMQKANPQGWANPEHKIIKQILTPPTFRF